MSSEFAKSHTTAGVRCAFTVDVEDYFQVEAFSATVDRGRWDGFELRVAANTRRILDLLDECQVRGTFFTLGWVVERCPDLIRDIAQRGHEVACHGMSHRLVYKQEPAEFRRETRGSKHLLEDLAQRPVIGYRAATYSIVKRSMWALDILLEEGFRYDSSIFPVRHDKYGVPDAMPSPHTLGTPAGGEIVEFPISVARLPGFNLPVAGGGYFRLFPYALSRWGLRQSLRQHGAMVFYLHPWEIDVEQPRIQGAPLLSRFRHYLNLHRTEQRLRRLMGDFAFAPMAQVLTDIGLL